MEYARFFLTDAFTAAAICCTGLLLALLNCKAVIAGYKQAWQILRHWKLEKYDPQSQRLLARCIAGLLCILVLGAISAPKLRYALPLLFEDVGQLEQIEGRIERVKNADVNDIYRYRDTYEHPQLIQVGEKQLFTLALGELKEGDAVCVSYLPHSRLALSILPKGAQAQTTPEFGREFYCFRALVPLSLSLFAAAFGLLAWALLDTGTEVVGDKGSELLFYIENGKLYRFDGETAAVILETAPESIAGTMECFDDGTFLYLDKTTLYYYDGARFFRILENVEEFQLAACQKDTSNERFVDD